MTTTTRPDSNHEDTNREDAKREDANRERSDQADSKREDADRERSDQADSNREDSEREPTPGSQPGLRDARRVLVWVTRFLLAPLARLVYRPVVEGRHHVPRRGPVILASNHLSFVDSMVIPLVAPRPVVFLAKAEYFQGRGLRGTLVRWFFTALDCVPVERDNYRAALASLDAGVRVLDAGDVFGIYPEGTRSRDGRLYRGRTGVAWLALTTGAPVVPVALEGTQHIQPVGTRWPRVRRVAVRFGPPLVFGPEHGVAGSGRARREVTERVMRGIRELSTQEYAGCYNDPDQSDAGGRPPRRGETTTT
jgi:1-acyl-sn-glycerol-3-phosphate acyltransferase